jgi:hypothetical protein
MMNSSSVTVSDCSLLLITFLPLGFLHQNENDIIRRPTTQIVGYLDNSSKKQNRLAVGHLDKLYVYPQFLNVHVSYPLRIKSDDTEYMSRINFHTYC